MIKNAFDLIDELQACGISEKRAAIDYLFNLIQTAQELLYDYVTGQFDEDEYDDK